MTDKRKSIGSYGEDLACEHLRLQGYNILARNYRIKLGEIDIIARVGEVLVFVEVKTRKSLSYGYGLESITWKKQQTIKKIAEYYYNTLHNNNLQARIDVIDIVLNQDNSLQQLRHIESAF